MFRKLYIPIVASLAVVIAILSVVSSIYFVSNDIVASSTFPVSADGDLKIITDPGVLEQINNSVSIRVFGAEDTTIEMAIGHTPDVVAWVQNANYHHIQGLESWVSLKSDEIESDEVQSSKAQGLETIDSDMWSFFASQKGAVEASWTKKSGVFWSLLIVAKTANTGVPSPLTIEFTWHSKTTQSFLFYGLLLSLFLLVSCLVLHIIWRANSKSGGHSGNPKRLIDLVKPDKADDYELPTSTTIPSVAEFARVQESSFNSSLLTGNIPVRAASLNQANGFYNSPVNNDAWTYQAGAPAPQPGPTLAPTLGPSTGQIPILPGSGPQFDVTHKLNSAPTEAPMEQLSRKELRRRGFLLRKGGSDEKSS